MLVKDTESVVGLGKGSALGALAMLAQDTGKAGLTMVGLAHPMLVDSS